MIAGAARRLDIYLAFGAIAAKERLQFRIWFWVGLVTQVVFMVAWFSFWQAAFNSRHTIGGLHREQTIQYILFARLLAPALPFSLTGAMAVYIRQGLIAAELLRPIDFQMRFYVDSLARCFTVIVQLVVPTGLFAMVALGLRLPPDPALWLAFALTLLLGHAIMFFFDYLVACLAFYTTEAWGLMLLQMGIFTFASGALLPLTMLPGPLRTLTGVLPFSQALFVPVSLLSGITALDQLSRIILIQLLWVAGLIVASRLVFRVAVRAVTVQGG
jgi:ABC-2 type transport system permease protein